MDQTQIKHNKKILIILAIFFVFVYSFLAFKSGLVFNSPDENANYFFSGLLARESRFDYPLMENSDILHPRSMTVANQKIVPQSFLGMPLIYGSLGKIFGDNAIVFFTPIIAVISVLFFYEIIKKIFGEKVAFLSAILVFINPAFWYYSTHSMYHNVLFVSLLVMGIYFFLRNSDTENLKKEYLQTSHLETALKPPTPPPAGGLPLGGGGAHSPSLEGVRGRVKRDSSLVQKFGDSSINVILGSIFIGLSLMVRYSEIPWVILVLAILYFFNKEKTKKKQAIIFILTLIVLSLPILFLNNRLYGSPFASGYNPAGSSISANPITASIKNSSLLHTFRIIVLNIIRNFWNYCIYLFWWISLPACFGLFLLLKKYKNLGSRQKKYITAFLIASIYLILYYGSWSFHDNPDPSKITIGTSYARYWLPVYIFSMPFLSVLLLKITKGVRHPIGCRTPKCRNAILLCIITLLISYNFLFVFKLTDESIGRNVLGEYDEIKSKTLNLTEENSIIVAGYYDKLFFPDRMVIENIDEERDKRLGEIKKLVEKNYLVYYYSWNNDEDILYLNKILNKYNLIFANPKQIREGERLFQIKISPF